VKSTLADDIPIMHLTAQATSVPAFRDSIIMSVTELACFIHAVQDKSTTLLSTLQKLPSDDISNGHSSSISNSNFADTANVQQLSNNTTKMAEILADQIDQVPINTTTLVTPI
jgi:hypothetical protein